MKFYFTILGLVLCYTLIAQDRILTGNITSAEDILSMIGVSVLIKGSTIGMTTDVDGGGWQRRETTERMVDLKEGDYLMRIDITAEWF